jgi:two-component system, NtrC family, response regulator AtoC
LVENYPELPVIVVTAFGSLERAIATLRAGAFDFLTKPFVPEQLLLSVTRAAQHRALRGEVRRLKSQIDVQRNDVDFLGESPAIERIFETIARVGPTDASVLVTGESGTGKELVAKALHGRSHRAKAPLVAINCSAIPEALLESELFGHTRGAFTDAKMAKRGLFLEASGGTLFLDEVGEMPASMQVKLLRALETRMVRPVGGSSELAFDVRLIVATHRDLESQVERGLFREDLFYRINVVSLELPPLRARGHDILVLAQAFLERMRQKHKKDVSGMSTAFAERLLTYGWPGNVRELLNVIERAVVLTQYEELKVSDLPAKISDYQSRLLVFDADHVDELVTLEELEKRYILRVMEALAWSKSEATRVLGIDRSTLYRKLERYGITAPPTRSLEPMA